MRLIALLFIFIFQTPLFADENEVIPTMRKLDTYLLFGSTLAPKTAFRSEYNDGSSSYSSSGEDKDKSGFAFGADTVLRFNPSLGLSFVADLIRYKYKNAPSENMVHLGLGPRMAGVSGDFEFWGSVLIGYSVNYHAHTAQIEGGTMVMLTSDSMNGVQMSYRTGVDYSVSEKFKLRLQGSYATAKYKASANILNFPAMTHLASVKAKIDRSYGLVMVGVAFGF